MKKYILLILLGMQLLYSGEKVLHLHDEHLGKSLTISYFKDGEYVKNSLHILNKFLGDRRQKSYIEMDKKLFDLLYEVQKFVGFDKEIAFLSAYRSKKTNDKLRKQSIKVAKNSLHQKGKAIDIVVKGFPLKKLKDFVVSLKMGGVGYYPDKKNHFIHVDTGDVRYW